MELDFSLGKANSPDSRRRRNGARRTTQILPNNSKTHSKYVLDTFRKINFGPKFSKFFHLEMTKKNLEGEILAESLRPLFHKSYSFFLRKCESLHTFTTDLLRSASGSPQMAGGNPTKQLNGHNGTTLHHHNLLSTS